MPTPLHSLEIGRYTEWYHGLSLAVAGLHSTETRAKRYRAAGEYHLKKYCRINPNTAPDDLTKTVFGRCNAKAHQLHVEALELYPYISGMAPAGTFDKQGWLDYLDRYPSQSALIPTLRDWKDIHFTRRLLTEREQEQYIKDLQKSPLPALDFTRRRLEEIEKEPPFYYREIEAGQPLPAKSLVSDFIECLTQIDFAHYLKNEIEKLEAQALRNPAGGFEPVQWSGTATELFSLVADLQLTGLVEVSERGKAANLARIVCAVFTDKEGKPFAFENVSNKLSAILRGTEKGSKKRADFKAWT